MVILIIGFCIAMASILITIVIKRDKERKERQGKIDSILNDITKGGGK